MEEKSAGAVVFNEGNGRRYLLLFNEGRWDFPKGNMEKGESELDTVLREVREETGLKDIEVVAGFRRVIEYFYRREGKNVHKRVVYFLARAKEDKVTISSEHQGFGWFTFREALGKASYGNSKETLKAAEGFVSGRPESREVRGPRGGASPPA